MACCAPPVNSLNASVALKFDYANSNMTLLSLGLEFVDIPPCVKEAIIT